MTTKTISLRLDAYERLRKARIRPDESFTEVVLRAQRVDRGLTAREIRAMYRTDGPLCGEEALDRVKEANCTDALPRDRWSD